jgi:hypothetical protein
MQIDPQQIKGLLQFLDDDERTELFSLLEGYAGVWLPLPGSQLMAYNSQADIIGFGGAAGGGKTDLAIGLALTRHQHSAIFRREGTQLQGVIQRMTELLGGRDGFNGQDKIWRILGTNKIIELGSCPNPGDENRYQGRAKDLLVIDEAANFLESQVRFLMGWVRTTDPKVKCQTLMTFNPPTSAEGRWIVEFFAPWLDPDHLAPAEPGELRYFAMIDGTDTEVSNGEPFYHKGELVTPQSRTFIPSKIGNNPFLVSTGYMATLQAMPEPLRSQMLYGDFMAGVMDSEYQVIPTEWVELAMARWRDLPVKPPMLSQGIDVARGGEDATTIARLHEGLWFDKPLLIPGTQTPDGHATAAQVITSRRDNAVMHIDVVGVGASPYDILKGIGQTIGVDARVAAPGTDKSGKLRFFNFRSMMWWRFRELLDPSANNGVALPPDPDLKRELCTPIWSPSGDKIKVESREDIIKRLGHSPDTATAYVQAAILTPKRSAIEALGAHNVSRRNYNPLDFAR